MKIIFNKNLIIPFKFGKISECADCFNWFYGYKSWYKFINFLMVGIKIYD